MTHATQPKGGTEKSVLLFFTQTPLTKGVTAPAAAFFSCCRQSSFYSSDTLT